MAYDNVSYREARKKARSSNTISALTYSDALKIRSAFFNATKTPEQVPCKQNRAYQQLYTKFI